MSNVSTFAWDLRSADTPYRIPAVVCANSSTELAQGAACSYPPSRSMMHS